MKIFRKFKRLKRWKCSLNKFYKFRIIKSNSVRRRYQLSKANVSWIRKKSYISVSNSFQFSFTNANHFFLPLPLRFSNMCPALRQVSKLHHVASSISCDPRAKIEDTREKSKEMKTNGGQTLFRFRPRKRSFARKKHFPALFPRPRAAITLLHLFLQPISRSIDRSIHLSKVWKRV